MYIRLPYRLTLWLTVAILVLSTFMMQSGRRSLLEYHNLNDAGGLQLRQLYSLKKSPSSWQSYELKLSIVVVTYKKEKLFQKLLKSIAVQDTNFRFEVIIADNGCVEGLYKIIQDALGGVDRSPSNSSKAMSLEDQDAKRSSRMDLVLNALTRKAIDFKYLPLCHNPGYGTGNNLAYELADPDSQYVLFLNDDVVLRDTHFLQSMIDLINLQADTAGAVGCVLMNRDGSQVLEAGGIVWNDGSTAAYARGRTDFLDPHSAEDLHYARPVDYISAACLLIDIHLLKEIRGFDAEKYPAFYEDTDLQMKIQHIHKKKVWLQPLAVALHAEHGSFGISSSIKQMQSSHSVFKRIWGDHLTTKYLFPGPLSENPTFHSFRASDIRGRATSQKLPNILFLDSEIPYNNRRTFDNLILLQKIGWRITFYATSVQQSTDRKGLLHTDLHALCTDYKNKRSPDCVRLALQQAGIEVLQTTKNDTLVALLTKRPLYYNVIVVTNAELFHNMLLRNVPSSKSAKDKFTNAIAHCVVIYDIESLDVLLQDESREQLSIDNKNRTLETEWAPMEKLGNMNRTKSTSDGILGIDLIKHHADSVITATGHIRDSIWKLIKINNTLNSTNVHTNRQPMLGDANYMTSIGHTQLINHNSNKPPFKDRRIGILFVSSLDREHNSRYDVDAVLHFLQDVYPIVLQNLPGTKFTILGRTEDISLFHSILNNTMSKDSVMIEALCFDTERTSWYFDNALIHVAPELHATGIQYKVSDALAAGVPTIMSSQLAKHYDKSITNYGVCIGATPESFAECIISISTNEDVWNKFHKRAVDFSKRYQTISKNKLLWLRAVENAFRFKLGRGEKISEHDNFPTKGLGSKHCSRLMESYKDRYALTKLYEGDPMWSPLEHFYNANLTAGFIYNMDDELAYLATYREAKVLVAIGVYTTGWHHFKIRGEQKGLIYSPEDEEQYLEQYSDIKAEVSSNIFRNGWHHFTLYGKKENRTYGCW